MKTEKMLSLDVVVLCYNEEATIKKCLESLSKNKRISRIIVVDNNSTDKSAEIITSSQKLDNRIEIIREKKQGITYARTTGLNAATADIIARIDADTQVEAEWDEGILRFFADQPGTGAAVGPVYYYDLPLKNAIRRISWEYFVPLFSKINGGKTGLYGSNMEIRRSDWLAIRDELDDSLKKIMEDLAIRIELEKKNIKISYVRSATAGVSGRRFRTSPIRFLMYNLQVVRTYWLCGHKFKAIVAAPFFLIGWIGQLLVYTVLRFHDPTSMRFGLKVTKQVDRINP